MKHFSIFEINGKYGLKKNDYIALNATYDEIKVDENDGFIVKKSSYYGYYSVHTESLILKSVYEKIEIACLNNIINPCYYSIEINNHIDHIKFCRFSLPFDYGFCHVNSGKIIGLFDHDTILIEKESVGYIYPWKNEKKEYFYFEINDFICVYDDQCKEILPRNTYKRTTNFGQSRGVEILKEGSQYTIFNKNFVRLNEHPVENYFSLWIGHGLLIKMNGIWALFNKDFERKVQFKKMGASGKFKPVEDSLTVVISENKLFGLYNRNFEKIADHIFKKITHIEKSNFLVIDSNEKMLIYYFQESKKQLIHGPTDEIIKIRGYVNFNDKSFYHYYDNFISFNLDSNEYTIFKLDNQLCTVIEISKTKEIQLIKIQGTTTYFQTKNGFNFSVKNRSVSSSKFLRHINSEK